MKFEGGRGNRQEEVRNMNPQVPDELISAYFDGEVTPEERAAVERLLAENDESQRELNETARLSALLHSFPRESAPVDLATSVLQATNQLPIPSVPEIPGPVHRSSWNEWRAALISSVVTAAALLLVAWGLGHFDTHLAPSVATSSAPVELRTTAHDRTPKDAAVEFGTEPTADSKVALNDQVLRSKQQPHSEGLMEAPSLDVGLSRKQSAMDAPGSVPLPKSTPLASKAAQRFATDNSVSKSTPEKPASVAAQMPALATAPNEPIKEQATESESLQIDNYSNLLSNQAFLDKLQVGEMYTFVPQVADPDNTVGVVDLEVVDIDRGAETMQVLLRKNEIQPRSVSDARDASQKKMKRSDDDLVVVYAVAPGDRLVQALNDVNQHPDLFRSWSSQVPLQVAEGEPSRARYQNEAEAAKDKGEADKSQAPGAMRRSAVDENETVDAQRALATLVARGASLQYNGAANAAGSPSVSGGSKGVGDSLPGPQAPASRTSREVAEVKRNERQQRQSNTGKGDYEVLRVPVNNPVAQLNSMNRPMQQNALDFRRNGMGVQLNEKAGQRLDVNNGRAVRMLFVLHPAVQADADQTAPAAAAPVPSKASK